MRLGIRLLDDLGPARTLVDLAVLAEEQGFDSVWFPHDTFRFNSMVLTSATARATRRVLLGARTNLYTMDPCEIATYAATLDDLSGGRVLLSIGLHTTDMLRWVGLEARDVLQRTREVTDIVRRLLRGGPVPYQGREFRWTERAYLRVPPVRDRIPIYICPFGPDYLELSGEIGDGSLPMITPPESARLMVEPIHRGARRAGRDPAEIDVVGFCWISVSEDGAAARACLADVCAYFGSYLEERALATIGLHPRDYLPAQQLVLAGDRRGARALIQGDLLRLGIAGTPDECIHQLESVVAAGCTHLSLGGPLGPDPAAAIRLLGARVLPYFR